MKRISFAWTTPALLAGRKTVTRREWKYSYALTLYQGERLTAYSRSPHVGGKPVAVIRLIREPYREAFPPPEDWEAEGFEYLTEMGATVNRQTPEALWDDWMMNGTGHLWVVRFELVEVFAVTPEPPGGR